MQPPSQNRGLFMTGRSEKSLMCNAIDFVQGYGELKWGISKLNPVCNGPYDKVHFCKNLR